MSGEVLKTPVCWMFCWLVTSYASTQPLLWSLQPLDPKPMYRVPFCSNRPGRFFWCRLLKSIVVTLQALAGGRDFNGRHQVRAAGNVQGVQVVIDGRIKNRLRYQIHGVGVLIDDRRSYNAFLGESSERAARQIFAAGRYAAIEHAGRPQLASPLSASNGVDRIRLRNDINDVMALAANVHIRYIERLGERLIVDGNAEEVAKAWPR